MGLLFAFLLLFVLHNKVYTKLTSFSFPTTVDEQKKTRESREMVKSIWRYITAHSIELPFEEFIDYRSFTVKIAEADISQLKEVLKAIPAETIKKKQVSGL